MYHGQTVVKVKLKKEEVLSVTYCFPTGLKTDYYRGKLLYTKQKDTESDTILVTCYDSEGNPFYTSSEEEVYSYNGVDYNSKKEFYKRLLSDYYFTSKDVLSIDWCYGYEPMIIEAKDQAKVVVPFHSEMLIESSLYPRKEVFEHTNLLGELFYLAQQTDQKEPYCKVKAGAMFMVEHASDIDAVYPQTEAVKAILLEHMEAGLLPSIAVEVYKMLDFQSAPNRSNGDKKICSVSRLSPEKRIDWIIKSVFFAHKKDPSITLDIYGRGAKEEEDKLKQLVKDLKAEDYIVFKGWLKNKEKMADYGLFMSTSLTEGYPLAVQEAISFGCPVLLSDIVGHRELVDGNGILVHFGGKTENMYCLELSEAIIESLQRFDEFTAKAEEFTMAHLSQNVVESNIKRLFS